MTELERQLLKALESLDGGYRAQHAAWEIAYSALRQMFEATSTENRALR
ncbi:MbeD family mobilization/exclusion protein, partial [Aeromonas veronii]